MSTAIKRESIGPMTSDEFLAWESRQPVKYEFDGQYPVSWGHDTIVPVDMVGSSLFHSTIQSNLITLLSNKLSGKPCRPHGSDVKVKIDQKHRYPDALVLCRPPKIDEFIIDDPTVVFEILSDSSWHRDMVVKSQDYQSVECVQHYVVLSQQEIFAWQYTKPVWQPLQLIGPHAVIDISALDINIVLGELYVGLDFTK